MSQNKWLISFTMPEFRVIINRIVNAPGELFYHIPVKRFFFVAGIQAVKLTKNNTAWVKFPAVLYLMQGAVKLFRRYPRIFQHHNFI